jgi:Leucine-rich repeat (LRR) protein
LNDIDRSRPFSYGRVSQAFLREGGINRKKLIGIIVACAIVIGVATAVAIRTPTKNDPEVAFADPKLEGVVRQTIDIPEGTIYASNLGALTTLVAYGMNITDLAGLEYCVRMTELSLFDNQISDISPLAGLVKLKSLHLWENRIADISPLADLARLEYLTVEGNQISDISPLEGLTQLTWLYLGRNQISDISTLAKHSRLTWLSLWGNQLADISPLSNLTSLERLWLNDNQTSDISPLVDNTGLGEGDTVYLQNNPLSEESVNVYIPELEARGVTVYYQD